MPSMLTTRRFTVDEYYRMAEAGILDHRERVELIEGEIVRTAAIGSRHAECVDRLTRMLVPAVEGRGTVRVQNPVRLSSYSEPEPDVAIVRSRPEGYADRHPGPRDVLLVVEVGDATLWLDREVNVKVPLYAGAGIPECWIVDLVEDRIDVHRQPRDEGYARIDPYDRNDVVRPVGFPELRPSVDDVLPPPTGTATP